MLGQAGDFPLGCLMFTPIPLQNDFLRWAPIALLALHVGLWLFIRHRRPPVPLAQQHRSFALVEVAQVVRAPDEVRGAGVVDGRWAAAQGTGDVLVVAGFTHRGLRSALRADGTQRHSA